MPDEFKDFPQELDDTMDIPLTIRSKTHTNHRWNFKLGNAMRSSYKSQRRYKVHK